MDQRTQAIKELLSKEVPGLNWDVQADRVQAVFSIRATVKIDDREMVVEANLPFEEDKKGEAALKPLSQDVIREITEGFSKRIAGK